MKSVLVDLSVGYHESRGAAVPPVREGKFVLLRAGGSVEFVVLADGRQCGYHADVAEAFCSGSGRALRGRRDGGIFLLEEPGWSVAGGGRFRLDTRERTLSLHGRSHAYGRFDGAGLAERLRASPSLAGYEVTLGP